ncbi:c-type cytochrome [Aurantimonas sp. VKM B-3413]|uniref:c-type cytochrome n=1 Tax=Aurantimonas sp. VKM B-3413 TaxID=2779401 RepID=UPI001E5A4454|nr:c-type cytochrome [Aurantimonas sp. VKM B-3413]MCB8838257.1 c-type cytochrome [Aurantimonas sp. VKM B-3413]
MTKKFYAFAATILLSTSGLAIAQSGTTIVPAGQSAGAATSAGETGAAAASQADGSSAAAKTDAGAGSPDAAAAADSGGQASSDKQMASNDKMKPDAHPSKDTAAEGNSGEKGDLGEYKDSAGNPVYNISADGTYDWYAWRGYKKYMANCMQCHGPDGLGSSFAPNLTDQLTNLSYYDFAGIVVSGQKNKWSPSGNSVMPAWGEDPNVMCSLDAIYVYLRGRADGVIPRGEPKPHDKNKEAQDQEYSCLGF